MYYIHLSLEWQDAQRIETKWPCHDPLSPHTIKHINQKFAADTNNGLYH